MRERIAEINRGNRAARRARADASRLDARMDSFRCAYLQDREARRSAEAPGELLRSHRSTVRKIVAGRSQARGLMAAERRPRRARRRPEGDGCQGIGGGAEPRGGIRARRPAVHHGDANGRRRRRAYRCLALVFAPRRQFARDRIRSRRVSSACDGSASTKFRSSDPTRTCAASSRRCDGHLPRTRSRIIPAADRTDK